MNFNFISSVFNFFHPSSFMTVVFTIYKMKTIIDGES